MPEPRGPPRAVLGGGLPDNFEEEHAGGGEDFRPRGTSLTGLSVVAYTRPVEIRFSRHAKNKMRLYGLTQEEVAEVITLGEKLSRGDKQESQHGRLRVIWLMVGSYALVVTVIKARPR